MTEPYEIGARLFDLQTNILKLSAKPRFSRWDIGVYFSYTSEMRELFPLRNKQNFTEDTNFMMAMERHLRLEALKND